MKKIIRVSTIILAITCLSACNQTKYLTADDPGTATIRIYKNNNSTSKDRYISPKNVEMLYSYNTLSGTLSNNENVCPSVGDVNLLVIPCHLPGATNNTDQVLSDIKTAFFSENSDRMGYPSLKEYYYESSYGKLNFDGFVTDWFDVAANTNIKSQSEITSGANGTIMSEILRKGVDWAVETFNLDLKDFDKNQDGAIDAVWLIYDEYDFNTQYSFKLHEDPYYNPANLNQAFWNSTSWDWSTPNNIDNPTTSAFSWASFDMMYTSYCDYDQTYLSPIFDDLSSIKLSSHTFIHETGHLMGLDDYYASDDSNYHPAGGYTMMDQNVCDLDSYSKMLLGWVTPYIAYGTSEILIPTATSSDEAVIVIPSNYEEISNEIEGLTPEGKKNYVYEFNPFSEYIMIDLYSPDGLNEQDTYGPLIYDRESAMSKTGVRIYHVDSRIFQCKVVTYDGGQAFTYVDGYEWDGERLADDEAILMPINNQKYESEMFQLPNHFDYFDQIRLLEATQIETFSQGQLATNYTLFDVDSEPFNINTFGYQFFNANYAFNNGKDLPFLVKVETLKEII